MRRFTRGPVHRPRAYLMTGTTTRNSLRKLRSRRTQRTPRESRRGLVPILRLCAVASVALVGLSIGVWMTRSRTRMPHLDRWRKMLARTQGIAQAERLAARMQARYEVLRAEHPQPRSLALRVHRNHMILPGLAVYVALREEGIAKDTALAEVQSLLFQVPSLLGLTMMLLRYVPDPLRALRWINNVSLLAAFPSDGWDTQIVAATKDLYAFNISRCYYLDVFAEHGAPELTALYCRLDDVAFAQLPASVRWERTTTLGRGGSCCDFRWSRVDVSTAVASRRDTAVCADCHEHRHSGAYLHLKGPGGE